MSGFRSLVAWWLGGAWGPSSGDNFTDAIANIVEYDVPVAVIVDSFSAVQANADAEPTCSITDAFSVIATLDTGNITATATRI